MRKSMDKIIKAKKLGVSFQEDLKKKLKDPKFRKAWEEPTGDVYLDTAFEIIKSREEKRLSQRELAKKVGTSQQAIARLENPLYKGRNLSTLEKIAKALDKKLEVKFI
jgi:DNA-binding XRE family transcriptional regulator